MVVVSDTSPIRALAHLGRLDLLQKQFTLVIVPPAVVVELRNPRKGQFVVNVEALPFVRVQPVSDRLSIDRFLDDLDLGESEALALALEIGSEFILMDEAAGRSRARQVGLVPIGIHGVLLEAEQCGDLERLSPLLDQLQNDLNFFISPQLRADVLRLAGESS